MIRPEITILGLIHVALFWQDTKRELVKANNDLIRMNDKLIANQSKSQSPQQSPRQDGPELPMAGGVLKKGNNTDTWRNRYIRLDDKNLELYDEKPDKMWRNQPGKSANKPKRIFKVKLVSH